LTKLVGSQQPTCFCVKMEFVVGTISISCQFFHFRASIFFHVLPAQLCIGNGVSFYWCSQDRI